MGCPVNKTDPPYLTCTFTVFDYEVKLATFLSNLHLAHPCTHAGPFILVEVSLEKVLPSTCDAPIHRHIKIISVFYFGKSPCARDMIIKPYTHVLKARVRT